MHKHTYAFKHGGIASAGHCVTFPQEVNEPAKIFPRLPSEINIVRVRKLVKMIHLKIIQYVDKKFKKLYFSLKTTILLTLTS